LSVDTVNGSRVTAGAAAVADEGVDVVVVVVVVVAGGLVELSVVWAPSGSEVATASAARPERVRSRAACLTVSLFIWSLCLGVEVITA
jgi:hypothetical protein